MRNVVAAVLMSLCVVVSGCGGASSDDGAAKQVRAAIDKALTSSDPAACTTLFTRAYIEQTQFTTGPAAVAVCREALRVGKPADAARTSDVTITDERAHADVAVQGGDEDGATYDLRLVRRDGVWKLDHIAAVELDFDRYLRAGRRQISRPPDELSAREADCVVARIRRIGEARLERAIVAADARIVTGSLIPCLGRRSLRHQFEAGILAGLEGQPHRRCVIARLRDSVTAKQIRAFVTASLAGDDEPSPALQGAIARALVGCGAGPAGGEAQSA